MPRLFNEDDLHDMLDLFCVAMAQVPWPVLREDLLRRGHEPQKIVNTLKKFTDAADRDPILDPADFS